jgi:hypothetical protein
MLKYTPHHTLYRLVAIIFTLTCAGITAAAGMDVPIVAELIVVEKIWDKAPHNAFTDLVRWHDRWYCAFREGDNHADSQGKLRVITSKEGAKWESAAIIASSVYDLRDANLSVMPDGRLMLVGGARLTGVKGRPTGTFASYSADGTTWTKPELILPVGRWMWGVNWHEGKAWGVSYGAPDRRGVNSLMTSADGQKFTMTVDKFFVQNDYPTEARIRFAKNGSAFCLQRTDGKSNPAYLGSAQSPYKDWTWKCLDCFIGGPIFPRAEIAAIPVWCGTMADCG